MTDQTVAHLQMIQSVVSRLAQNSFTYKGWAVTVVSAILALAVQQSRALYLFVALLPTLAFWGLDAYYLRQERLFRKLYDGVRTTPGASQAFSMDTSPYATQVATWWGTCWSKTIAWLYGPLVIILLITGLAYSPR